MRFLRSSWGIFLAALGIRLLAGAWLGHFSHPEGWEPEIIANNLLAGKGFLYDGHLGLSYRAYLLPAHPFFCAAVYRVTQHSQAAVLVLQCILSAASCLQIYAIGRLVFTRPEVALTAAWLTALHPGLVYYASLLHPLTLDLFSYLWVLWGFLSLREEPSSGKALLLGLGAGLALLSRGTILPFLVSAMLIFLLRSKSGRQLGRGLRAAAIVTAATLLVVTPWLVRNAAVFHRFPLFLTTASQSFWQGNNPLSVGTAHLPDGRPIIGKMPAGLQAELSRANEIGQSDLFRREGMAFIRRNPAAAVRLFLRKLRIFWWFSSTTGLYYPAAYTTGYGLYYGIAAAFALWGIWLLRRRFFSGPVPLLLLFLLSVAFFQSLYYVEGRHRWAVEPVLLLFSACGLFRVSHENKTA